MFNRQKRFEKRLRKIVDNIDKKGFYHGFLIHHTVKNPNRKVRGALTMESIDNLKRHLKYRWPVRFYLQETLPQKIRTFFYVKKRLFEDRIRLIKTYLNTSSRNDVLVIPTLSRTGYDDHDIKAFHAMFTLLDNFVSCRFEKIMNVIESQTNEQDATAEDIAKGYQELIDLYLWWKGRESSRNQVLDQYNSDIHKVKEKAGHKGRSVLFGLKNTPYHNEWKQLVMDRHQTEAQWEDEDREALIRLSKVYQHMVMW